MTEHIQDHLEATMGIIDANDSGNLKATATGFWELDHLTAGGFHPGELIVISGRTGHGKSTLALDLIRSAAIQQNKPALLFSMQDSTENVITRIMCAEADVSYSAVQRGTATDDQFVRLMERVTAIENAPIFINDTDTTLPAILEESRQAGKGHDLGLIVVDDLNLMTAGRTVESRYQEVAEFTRSLKRLAKELNVPVVAVSQFRRGIEDRGDDAYPVLWDMRDSGTLEQDADIVILVNRVDAENPDHERAGDVDLRVAKHRGGPVGTVRVAHQLHYAKFADLAPVASK